MVNLKTIAGGLAIAGSFGLAALGVGAGVAGAAPTPVAPTIPTVQSVSQSETQAPGWAAPSPYAAYGDAGLCGMPGMYFVNICS
jgi:hypothetical protein